MRLVSRPSGLFIFRMSEVACLPVLPITSEIKLSLYLVKGCMLPLWNMCLFVCDLCHLRLSIFGLGHSWRCRLDFR